jgi:hypothetical protein
MRTLISLSRTKASVAEGVRRSDPNPGAEVYCGIDQRILKVAFRSSKRLRIRNDPRFLSSKIYYIDFHLVVFENDSYGARSGKSSMKCNPTSKHVKANKSTSLTVIFNSIDKALGNITLWCRNRKCNKDIRPCIHCVKDISYKTLSSTPSSTSCSIMNAFLSLYHLMGIIPFLSSIRTFSYISQNHL